MIRYKKLIVLALCMWFMEPVVYGDMVSPAQLSCKYECPSQNLHSKESLLSDGLSEDCIFSGVAGFDFGSFDFVTVSNPEAGQIPDMRHLQISASGFDSCHLCLYTLMGLGFCGSVGRVRKISFGFIPAWYHDGGPSQVGHSYAVMPCSLRSVPIWNFIQPEYAWESLLLRYFKGVGVSLLRDSQFVSDVLSSRGPPN
jgi:hypothetical protein